MQQNALTYLCSLTGAEAVLFATTVVLLCWLSWGVLGVWDCVCWVGVETLSKCAVGSARSTSCSNSLKKSSISAGGSALILISAAEVVLVVLKGLLLLLLALLFVGDMSCIVIRYADVCCGCCSGTESESLCANRVVSDPASLLDLLATTPDVFSGILLAAEGEEESASCFQSSISSPSNTHVVPATYFPDPFFSPPPLLLLLLLLWVRLILLVASWPAAAEELEGNKKPLVAACVSLLDEGWSLPALVVS